MPSFENMPKELRMRVYQLMFVRPESIKVSSPPLNIPKAVGQQLAGSGRQGGKGKVQDEKGKAEDENAQVRTPPTGPLALLCTKQSINDEAASVLYGDNEFEFNDAKALEGFLVKIRNKIQHIRHIGISMGGFMHFGSVAAVRHSFEMLTPVAKDFRSFSISHFDLCGSAGTEQLQTSTLTLACTPLLQQLAVSYREQDLKADFRDVVKVVLPDCDGCFGCVKSGQQHVCRRRTVVDSVTHTRRRCQCLCVDAEENNKAMAEALKWWVKVQPGW